jgi:biopolymer transport protein ExbD
MRRRIRRNNEGSNIDITPFMNLMMILVPALLFNAVFTRINIIDLTLPHVAGLSASAEELKDKKIEVIVRSDKMLVNFPAGTEMQALPKVNGKHDTETLSLVLQSLKKNLAGQGVDKKDIMILSEPNTDYQTIVSIMDSVRTYKTVVATSLVNSSLFPEIALGDAPDSVVVPEAVPAAPGGVQ